MERRFIINYYKDADSGIHIQKITDAVKAHTPHSHEYYQIYYILTGSLDHTTKDETATLKKGDAFIIPPGASHSISRVKNAEFYTLSFTREGFEPKGRASLLVTKFLEELSLSESVFSRISVNRDLELIESILDKLYTEFYEKEIGYNDVIRAYVCVILTILSRAYLEAHPIPLSSSDVRARITAAIEYIDTSFQEPLTLSDMARWCAMSKSEFCKKFLNVSGSTFGKYLHRTRICHAAELIKNNCNVSAAASLSGYNDFSTFSRNFRKIMGTSPLKYKSKTRSS